MAEIQVTQQRRSMAWLWILLALLVLAAVGWYLWSNGYLGGTRTTADSTRAMITPVLDAAGRALARAA